MFTPMMHDLRRKIRPATETNSKMIDGHEALVQNNSEKSSHQALTVLVVDEELPFPLNTGKRIRTYNLLKKLASLHEITFLCHRNENAEELKHGIEEFRRLGITIDFLERKLPQPTLLTSKPRLAFQLGINLFSHYPYVVQKNVSSELRRRVNERVRQANVDLVHFEWTPYAAAVKKTLCKPWVVDAHNVESLIWKRYAQFETNPIKIAYVRYQWKKMDRFERKVFQKATRTIFVSKIDSEIARDEFGCQRRAVVDNGVDVSQFPFIDQTNRDPEKLLFLGSLDWRPNIDGINFFLDEIWPLILSKRPSLKLDIVGRTPASSLAKRISQEVNVTLYKDVPSVQPFLKQAGLMVVPLRIGGGSRLKILEALSMGLPVISTAVGAEGLDMESGTHFSQADSAEEFTEAVVESTDNPQSLSKMVHAARMLVEERYDWSMLAKYLDAVWQSVVRSAT